MTDRELAVLAGKRVREFREERGWSQQKLADLAGLQRPNVCRLEMGGHYNDRGRSGVPNLRTLHYVAQALGVQVWELLWVPSDHALEAAE